MYQNPGCSSLKTKKYTSYPPRKILLRFIDPYDQAPGVFPQVFV